MLRDGSHKRTSLKDGKPLAVPSEVGDLVGWSLRTTHAGFAARLRVVPRLYFPVNILARIVDSNYHLPPVFRPLPVRSASERLAMFITYG